MNQFSDWMQHWHKQQTQSMPFFNPFAYSQPPQFNGFPGASMSNPFQMFQDQQQLWQNYIPHNDLLAFWEKFSSNNFSTNSLSDIFVTPYLEKIKEAFERKDEEELKTQIRNLCGYWLEKSNFVLGKHLDSLAWQKDLLKMWFDNTRWDMLHSEYQNDVRGYFAALIDSYDELLQLMRIFDGFEQKVSDRFLDKVLNLEVELKDIEQLFGMWCDLFDSCYKEATFSDKYSKHFASFVGAISKCRATQQTIIDKSVEVLGLPSKREMDAVHRRIHKQEKALRELAAQEDAGTAELLEEMQQTLKEQQGAIQALQAANASRVDLEKEVKVLRDALKIKNLATSTKKPGASAKPKS